MRLVPELVSRPICVARGVKTRLDETVSKPGDVLHYLYDPGDNCELTLRVEDALLAERVTVPQRLSSMVSAAPPELRAPGRCRQPLRGALSATTPLDQRSISGQGQRPRPSRITCTGAHGVHGVWSNWRQLRCTSPSSAPPASACGPQSDLHLRGRRSKYRHHRRSRATSAGRADRI